MLNEEDHIRIQSICAGDDINNAFILSDNIDNVILTGSNYYTLPVKNRIEKEAISRYNKKIKVEVK